MRPARWISKHSAFCLTLRGARAVFLLLNQFSSELETETEVILTSLIKLIDAETVAEPWLGG